MALIWKKQTSDTRYEVRSAGASIRLYTNGVFHSQYNPRRVISGQVWDLLILPSLFYAPGQIKRVLVLGVGGGAVIRQLEQIVKPKTTVGVDLDRQHLVIARQFFQIRNRHTQLVCADAMDWLANYRGPAFDMIIDDVFTDEDGEPVRALEINPRWLNQLDRNLSSNGVLVINFASRQEFKQCLSKNKPKLSKFKSIFQLSTDFTDNRVGAFLHKKCSSNYLRQAIKSYHEQQPGINFGDLRYRIMKIDN